MIFTDEQISEIESLAALNYSIPQVGVYLDVSIPLLYAEFDLPDSQFRYHYKRGQLVAQAQIDMSNLESAKKGNITAQQRYDKRARQVKIDQAKERIFRGD